MGGACLIEMYFYFRHTEIMNEFKKTNKKIDIIGVKIDRQTSILQYTMRQIQLQRLLPQMKELERLYDKYFENNEDSEFGRLLIREYDSRDASKAIYEVRLSIQNYFRAYMNSEGNCVKLYEFHLLMIARLTKAKWALALGCGLNGKKRGYR